jgi:hypothetical protein
MASQPRVGTRTAHTPLGGGSLVAELRPAEDTCIVTADSWRCLPSPVWTPSAPRSIIMSQLGETLDARLLDPDWNLPGYDDSR